MKNKYTIEKTPFKISGNQPTYPSDEQNYHYKVYKNNAWVSTGDFVECCCKFIYFNSYTSGLDVDGDAYKMMNEKAKRCWVLAKDHFVEKVKKSKSKNSYSISL